MLLDYISKFSNFDYIFDRLVAAWIIKLAVLK